MVAFATQVKRRRGTTAQNDAFTGAEGEIVVDTERHELRVHDGVTQGGFKIGGGSGSGRNIGDIFYTKRTDTALAGAVECNGGTYNTTDYDGDGSIGELLESGKLDYISLTDYATAISTKGWCDKIGWNGTGTTSFRVPTLTPRIIQTNSIPVVGNGMALGLTDGQVNYGLGKMLSGNVGFLQGETSWINTQAGTSSASGTTPANNISLGITTDPTKSGMIADLSETANLRVMVQLATGATDQALETCTSVLADVAGLKDMSNVTATGKNTVVGWGMPDYSAGISLSGWGTVNSNFSVPTDGVLQIVISATSALEEFFVDEKISCALVNTSNYTGWAVNFFLVSKGTHTWRASSTPSRINAVVFYPFKGVN